MSSAPHRAISRPAARGFTLTELLVVMGIIAVLGVLTAVGYRGIAKDAKLSSGKNTLMAVLDNARGLSMKENRIVMVVFRPRLDGNRQFIEAVFAEWSRDCGRPNVPNYGTPPVVDRFIPIKNTPSRAFPAGIKIAGPSFASGDDTTWITQTHLPAINQLTGNGESPGELIGVMFAPDGTSITRNSATDSIRAWVDFDGDGLQRIGTGAPVNYATNPAPTIPAAAFDGGWFEQRLAGEESFVDIVPFLSIFDDDAVRDLNDVAQWDTANNPNAFTARLTAYTTYLTSRSDRIHFNRYTGVAMK